MAKYDPLRDHLLKASASRLTLTFAQIDSIVGGLPPTAYDKDEWWANENIRETRHSQCKSWQEAGYKVSADRKSKTATFSKS